FQAEDGIRDFHVTGVQTCALPIWAVDAYWREVEAANLVKRKLLARVERHLRGEVEIAHRVEVRRVDEQKVISMESHVLADKLPRSEEHTSELQSRENLVCRLLLET